MKQGKTLTELATELERHHTSKRDFIADTQQLELVPRLTLREDGQTVSSPERLQLKSENTTLDFSLTPHSRADAS